MSRVGNAPVKISSGVEVKVNGNIISVKGPKGELTQNFDTRIEIEQKDGELTFKRNSDDKEIRSKHGLYRALVNNMVIGVSTGFTKKLEFHGVGYRAACKGQILEMSVGYSHGISFEIPKEVKVSAASEKGQPPIVTLESHDKELLGQVAAKIRSFRKPEPYKGKGIRYSDEFIRRKAGKSAAK